MILKIFNHYLQNYYQKFLDTKKYPYFSNIVEELLPYVFEFSDLYNIILGFIVIEYEKNQLSENELSNNPLIHIIKQLSALNPTKEPAAAYCKKNGGAPNDDGPTLSGKWTLIYTDAPDITSLDPSSSTSSYSASYPSES